MKALKISTALSLLVIASAAPRAYSVGDPNIDSGVGSAASRGPFGFNNNNDPVYDTPANSYGVYRDAYGGLRDSGNIPDNLVVRVKEPTWEESHQPKGPAPSGAPGGLFGGIGAYGGLGGLGVLGGLGGGLGLGPLGFGLGFPGNPLGLGGPSIPFAGSSLANFPFAGSLARFPYGGGAAVGYNASGIPISMSGIGPTGSNLRTPYGFVGSPGTFFPGSPFTTDRYLGPHSGFIPRSVRTTRNITENGVSTDITFENNSSGPFYSRSSSLASSTSGTTSGTTSGSTSGTTGGTTAGSTGNPFAQQQPFSRSFYYNGNSESFTQNISTPFGTTPGTTGGTTSGTTGGTASGTFTGNPNGDQPAPNTMVTTTRSSNNAFTNPFAPNGVNTLTNNTPQTSFSGGFATPGSSGSEASALFQNSNLNYGTATPQTSGSQNSVFFNNSLNSTSIGGGFATLQTSGSEKSVNYANTNSSFGAGFGGVGGGLGGFPTATGNRAAWANTQGSVSGELESNESGTNSSSGAPVNPSLEGNASPAKTNGFYNGSLSTGQGQMPPGFSRGFFPSSNPQNTLAMAPTTSSFNPTETVVSGPWSAGSPSRARIIRAGVSPLPKPMPLVNRIRTMQAMVPGTRTIEQATVTQIPMPPPNGIDYSAAAAVPPLSFYTANRVRTERLNTQSFTSGGNGLQGNVTTDLEVNLARMNLCPSTALGRVIGSFRYQSGEIITYGTRATLRLATDNSGSMTFNDGEILTFRRAPELLRLMALRSALML